MDEQETQRMAQQLARSAMKRRKAAWRVRLAVVIVFLVIPTGIISGLLLHHSGLPKLMATALQLVIVVAVAILAGRISAVEWKVWRR